MADQASYAGIGSDAVRAKTGKTWPQWFTLLDKAGAASWPHKKIAKHLHTECGCPDWWSQMVTVGYEQARGLRVKHQSSTGFTANASKTISVPVAKLYQSWNDPKSLVGWLRDGKAMTIRKVNANKSMRITWIDGETSVEVHFWVKGPAKSQVAVQHSKLKSLKEVARLKAYWAAALLKLQAMLEGATTAAARSSRPKTVAKKRSAR